MRRHVRPSRPVLAAAVAAVTLVVGVPRALAQAGTVAEFPVPSANAAPQDVAAGPDGNVWFTEFNGNRVGRVTPAGTIAEFPIPTPGAGPMDIAPGPDGNLWFTEFNANRIGRITPAGAVTERALPAPNRGPSGVAAGPDGNLWFTQFSANRIGNMTPAGVFTDFAPLPTGASGPTRIAAGPDGNLWFTELFGNKIGRITPAGAVTEFAVPTANAQPLDIAPGPDGNLWFTEFNANRIGRITPAGVITEFPVPTANAGPQGIAAGPDGNLYFTEFNGNRIGRITPAGAVTEFPPLPTAASGPVGVTAGPDANVWFTERTANKVGRLELRDPLTRLFGADRIDTAVAVSANAFPGPAAARAVVLARSDNFPDALAGTPLAVAQGAPLLLSPPAGLDPRTRTELTRVLTPGRTVYLLGGTAALGAAVEAEVAGLGYPVVRLGGADRYATAVAVAERLGTPTQLFLATGSSFQDALLAGVAAAKVGGAVVLTAGPALPAPTTAYLATRPGVPRAAVGAEAVAADPAARALAGANQYETSRLVAQAFFPNPTVVGLASGTVFPDALTGGAHVGARGGPLLLVDPATSPPPVQDYLRANAATVAGGFLYGGTAAVGAAVADAAQRAFSGLATT